MRINMVIRTETQRPTNLLVIINPFGGARKARKIWRKKAEPVFLLAGRPQSGGSVPITHICTLLQDRLVFLVSSPQDELSASMHMISKHAHPSCRNRVQVDIFMRLSSIVNCCSGIKSTVVETQRADHAKEIVTGLSLSELQSFDGFIAVCPSPCTVLLATRPSSLKLQFRQIEIALLPLLYVQPCLILRQQPQQGRL